jgi:uncharacterized RDD family membrane protein YckC
MDAGVDPGRRFCSQCGRPAPEDELARFGELLVCPECKPTYAQKLREGVAPPVTSNYAGFWIRFGAAMIDGLIMGLVTGILQFAMLGSLAATMQAESEDTLLALRLLGRLGVAYALSLAIGCAYESLFVSRMGATPGKLALGLKVVRPDGSLLPLGRSIGRHFAKMLNSFTLGVGYLLAAFDAQKRALHDMICDTRVIRARDI